MNNKPQAHISVSKNRVRKGREVYLKDDTEFEIELFNPTQSVVCARIWINGHELQGGALVLNPAQRYHLDRYLDQPKKFKFSTYEVSGSKEEIEHAIAKNGLIQVKFYNEIIPVVQNPVITPNPWCNPQPWSGSPIVYGGTPQNPNQYDFYCGTTLTHTGPDLSNCTLINDGSINMDFLSSSGTTSCNFVSSNFDMNEYLEMNKELNDQVEEVQKANKESFGKNLKKKTKAKETGRIEAGSQSEQTFEYVNKSFAFSPCAEFEYAILPVSEKVVEANNVGGKVYCTGCKLRKRKPNWEFCPKCGTQFEF